MDAVEYIKTLRRLCKSQGRCSGCVLYEKEDDGCISDISEYTEKAVQIVEQWAKEHPVYTRQSEFLKQYPNARQKDGVVVICPLNLDNDFGCKNGKTAQSYCEECRRRYWLAEI